MLLSNNVELPISSQYDVLANIDESVNVQQLNEFHPAIMPILRVAGPKLVKLASGLFKTGVAQKGIKTAAKTFAQDPEGRNLLVAIKAGLKQAGKALDLKTLAQIIAIVGAGDTGDKIDKASTDSNVEKLVQILLQQQNTQQQSQQQPATETA